MVRRAENTARAFLSKLAGLKAMGSSKYLIRAFREGGKLDRRGYVKRRRNVKIPDGAIHLGKAHDAVPSAVYGRE